MKCLVWSMLAHAQKTSNRIFRLTGGNLVLSRKVWSWTSCHLVLHYGHHQVEDTPCIVIYNTGDLVSPNKPITQRLVPVDKVWKLVLSTSYQNHHHHQSLCQTNLFLNEHHSRCRQRSLWARLQSIWSTLTPPRCCSPPGTFGRHLIDRD